MTVWNQTIRSGNPATDNQMVEAARAHASGQGLVLQVQPLPGGGFQVQAVHPNALATSPPAGPVNPYAAPAAMQVAQPGAMAWQRGGGGVGGNCQVCQRSAPTKSVMFMQNIGCIIIRFPKTLRGNLCRTCISDVFWRYTLITFFFGWWGVISFFYSLVSIPTNIVTFLGARSLPASFDGTPGG
jgi:hypothetical protein